MPFPTSFPAEGPDDAALTDVTELVQMAVNRVFSVSLLLASAREGLGDHPVSNRLSEAIDGMDALIRELRRAAFAGPAAANADSGFEPSLRPVADVVKPTPATNPSTEELLDLIRYKQRAALQRRCQPQQTPHSA